MILNSNLLVEVKYFPKLLAYIARRVCRSCGNRLCFDSADYSVGGSKGIGVSCEEGRVDRDYVRSLGRWLVEHNVGASFSFPSSRDVRVVFVGVNSSLSMVTVLPWRLARDFGVIVKNNASFDEAMERVGYKLWLDLIGVVPSYSSIAFLPSPLPYWIVEFLYVFMHSNRV